MKSFIDHLLDEAKKANTASTRAELSNRPRKELTGADADKKKKESDDAWERLMAHAAKKKANEEVITEGAYEKAEENKKSADAAKAQGDMFAHHMHMADHHDNLAQWHGEKGRHGEADRHAEKAEKHHEEAMKLKESFGPMVAGRKSDRDPSNDNERGLGSLVPSKAPKKPLSDLQKLKRKNSARKVKESVELDEAKDHTIEAHGIKGMKGTPWRKTFKSHEHLNDWADKNDSVEVHGTRDLEGTKKKTNEEVDLDEAKLSKGKALAAAINKANKDRKDPQRYSNREFQDKIDQKMKAVGRENDHKKFAEPHLKEQKVELDEGLNPSEIASNPRMYSAADVKKAFYHKKATESEKQSLAKRLDRYHGSKDWRKPVKEHIEQLDELSSDTLQSYKDKAMKSAEDQASKGNYKKSTNRLMGHMKATGKQMSKLFKKEEIERCEVCGKVACECDDSHGFVEGKKPGHLNPGWMLKVDPELAKKVADNKKKFKSFKDTVGKKIETK